MDIEKVKGLSGGAARLLSVYLLLGGQAGETSTKEVMRLAGAKDRSNFYRDRKRLEDAGFVVKARSDTHRVSSALFSVSSASPAVGSLHSPTPDIDLIGYDQIRSNLSNLSSGELKRLLELADKEDAVIVTLPPDVNITPSSVNITPDDVTITPSVNTTPDDVNITPPSVNTTPPLRLIDRCMDVDEMDSSGLETSRNSPFFLRRQAQIPLVKEIWREFFPNALMVTDQNAKYYLSWCDNRAAMVYEGIEELVRRTKDIKSPVAFLNKALRGWAAEQKEAQQLPAPRPQGTRPAATTSPARRMSEYELVTKGDMITSDELYKPSDEERQKMKEFQKKYADIEW